MENRYRPVGTLNESTDFEAYLKQIEVDLGFDVDLTDGGRNVLGQSYQLDEHRIIGNRFCALPIEGSDALPGGSPSELTFRRWGNAGLSGAKLIWGGEATAVCAQGRSNPNQLMLTEETLSEFTRLRERLVEQHIAKHGTADDLMVGLQLTHAGRFSRPDSLAHPEPAILHHHPDLDSLLSTGTDLQVLTDDQILEIEEQFIRAACLAEAAGFDFVDIQHSNGSLGHEFLSAWERPGPFGGSIENRTRFLHDIVEGIRDRTSSLRVGVRLSLYDFPPFREDLETGFGRAVDLTYPRSAMFGGHPVDPTGVDLEEPLAVIEQMEQIGVKMLNITAGSSHYNYHVAYPAYYPPLGMYQPPEDPLHQVALQMRATAEVKRRFPSMLVVGSAYSYLQEWIPHVAHYNVRTGRTDFVGLGRALLSYPELPAEILSGERINRQRICRTYSDCVTAPEFGLAAGCYPLDRHYMRHPDGKELRLKKREFKQASQNTGS